MSRYNTDAEGLDCERAVVVSEAWQKKGLGTLLVKHLIEVARARGLRRVFPIDSAENMQMKDLAMHLGFKTRVDPEDASQVLHEFALQPPE